MRFFLTCPKGEFEAVAPLGVDLDSLFDAYDVDNAEWVTKIESWNCDVEILADIGLGDDVPPALNAWNGLSDQERRSILASVGAAEPVGPALAACLATVEARAQIAADAART